MVGKAVIRLYQSRGLKVGRKENDLLPVHTRPDQPLGDARGLLTGDYTLNTPALPNNEATIVMAQDYPLPFTLSAAFLAPIVSED